MHSSATKHITYTAICNTNTTTVSPRTYYLRHQILAKKILTPYIYEDDCCVAFDDNNPQAPVHFLVIPKDKDGANRISQTDEKHKPLLGHLLYVAKHVATTIKGLCNVRDKNTGLGLGLGGYRIVINDGEIAGQSIPGLCVHVLGGRPLSWPPG